LPLDWPRHWVKVALSLPDGSGADGEEIDSLVGAASDLNVLADFFGEPRP
jgi:hypothetical protein